jgi:hypothetical protein
MDRTGRNALDEVTAAPMANRARLGEAWVRALHEVAFGEPPVRVQAGRVTSGPLDAQIVLVAPGGASALLTTCWYGRAEPVDGPALAERVQAALTDRIGRGVRCLHTRGPLSNDEGAWSEGATGSVGLVFAPSWLSAMGTPPVPTGTSVRLDIGLDGWPGSGGGTIVFDGDVALEVTCEGRSFTAAGRVDTASFQLRESERDFAGRVPCGRFDGSVLGVRRGAWNVELSADGVLMVGGRAQGTVRWVTDGTRVAIRVDPESAATTSRTDAGSADEVETVVMDREAMRDVLRGRGAVATDEPR